MNILITGSSGMVGTRLCEKLLLNKDINLFCWDIKKNIFNNKINKITTLINLKSKIEVIKNFPEQIDIVIHLAANARVYDLIKDPNLAIDNVITTFNILEVCRIKNVKKIIFSSSREVYGDSSLKLSENEVNIDNCENTYSASKISNEVFIKSYQSCYDIDFIILRFSNVYGMYDLSNRIIPLFIQKILKNEELIIYGKEKAINFIYIDDIIDFILISVKNFNDFKNEKYNVATDENINIIELVKKLDFLLNKKSIIKYLSNRIGETVSFIPNISKAKEKMNWKYKISFEKGIKKAVEWYLSWLKKQ